MSDSLTESFSSSESFHPARGKLTLACDDDPYNVCALASKIADHVLQHEDGIPIISENHEAPATIALQIALANEMIKRLPPGHRLQFFKEKPSNALITEVLEMCSADLRGRIENMRWPGNMMVADEHGDRSLETSLAFLIYAGASYTQKTLEVFCLEEVRRRKISFRFFDVARKIKDGVEIINTDDRLTAYVLDELKIKTDEDIPFHSALGFFIRNAFMAMDLERKRYWVKNSDTNYKTNPFPKCIAAIGKTHMLGSICEGESFERSMVACALEKGMNIIPIFISEPGFGAEDIPARGRQILLERGIAINGLDMSRFNRLADDEEIGMDNVDLFADFAFFGNIVASSPDMPHIPNPYVIKNRLWPNMPDRMAELVELAEEAHRRKTGQASLSSRPLREVVPIPFGWP